jgi:hypothetical protein
VLYFFEAVFEAAPTPPAHHNTHHQVLHSHDTVTRPLKLAGCHVQQCHKSITILGGEYLSQSLSLVLIDLASK